MADQYFEGIGRRKEASARVRLHSGGNGNIVIKALANGLFVTAENAGSSPLIANRTAAQTWEQFQ